MRSINRLMMSCVCLAFVGLAAAKSVTAVALFKDRAMISVDGSKAKIVKAGASYKGVTLINSTTSEAVIEVDGKRDLLTLEGGYRVICFVRRETGGFTRLIGYIV